MIKSNYKIFDPKIDAPLHALDRKAAKEHFDLYLNTLDERISELKKMTEKEGIYLDFSMDSIEKLDDWFLSIVKPNNILKDEPDSITFSICNDLSLYLGEFIRIKCDGVKWKLNTLNKKDVSYQRPILTDFPKAKYKNQYVDIDLLLCQYAFRVLKGKPEDKYIYNVIGYILKLC